MLTLELPVEQEEDKAVRVKNKLKKEIAFWIKRVDNYEFLKAVRSLVRNEAVVKRVATQDSFPTAVREAIEEGLRDIAAGRLQTQEEVEKELFG